MTMLQILKIDEHVSFLTISVGKGERNSTPENQQIVQ